MPTTPTLPIDTRAAALTLAARAECDPRTARRALREGPGAIGTETIRRRLVREMRAMGLMPAKPGR
jgi:hypothetical protein